jgi:hypothetical protein
MRVGLRTLLYKSSPGRNTVPTLVTMLYQFILLFIPTESAFLFFHSIPTRTAPKFRTFADSVIHVSGILWPL